MYRKQDGRQPLRRGIRVKIWSRQSNSTHAASFPVLFFFSCLIQFLSGGGQFRSQRNCTDLEGEGLIEDGVERFAVHLGLVLLLLVWGQVDLDVGVGGATHVHAR